MEQHQKMESYYQLHAKVYDATRWTFLFGRKAVLKHLKLTALNRKHLLEIGCGSGANLKTLIQEYPAMTFTGIDISSAMLEVANQKLNQPTLKAQLLHHNYCEQPLPAGIHPPQIMLISYCLTMMNPGWAEALAHAARDLSPAGQIAIVDFHRSRFGWFRRWMGFNHVRMEAHLLPVLQQQFRQEFFVIKKVWFGLWEYFIFIGRKG